MKYIILIVSLVISVSVSAEQPLFAPCIDEFCDSVEISVYDDQPPLAFFAQCTDTTIGESSCKSKITDTPSGLPSMNEQCEWRHVPISGRRDTSTGSRVICVERKK